jgi:membrane protein implicated in regulation of membrane protease activity
MDFLNSATVTTLYLVLLGLGVVYALFLLFTGQLSADSHIDFGSGDAGVDLAGGVDHGIGSNGDTQHGISPISPLTVSTFVTAFGAVGLISRHLFNASDRISLLWASLGGLFFSILIYVGFTYLFIKPQGSSEVRLAEQIGKVAEVITPIPQDGIGEIAFIAQGGRVTYSARSRDESGIRRGQAVRIVRIIGGVAYVESIDQE